MSALPKFTGTIKKGSIPKYSSALPKHTSTIPKTTGTIPKTTGIASTSSGYIPKYNKNAGAVLKLSRKSNAAPTVAQTDPPIAPIATTATTQFSNIAPTLPVIDLTPPSIVVTAPTITDAIPKYTGTIRKGTVKGADVLQLFSPIKQTVLTVPPSIDPISTPEFTVTGTITNEVVQGCDPGTSFTPNRECRSSMAFTKEAIDVINECIKNGMVAEDTIKSQSSEIGSQLRKALTKVHQGTQAAIIFKDTISRVNAAIVAGNDEQVLKEFQIIIRDVNEMTNEDALHLAEIVYMTYTRNLISSFKETDLELNDILSKTPDEKTREITSVLIARNQIILNALNHISKKIPERYYNERQKMSQRKIEKTCKDTGITPQENTNLRKSLNASGTAKKLFILGESLHIPEGTEMETTQLEIRLKSDSNRPPTPGKDGEYRDRLSGYMRSPNGDMEEIVLELKEYIKEPLSSSSTSATSKVVAFIQNEMLDIDEISYLPELSNINKVVALIENEQTKERHQVEMKLVPKSPIQSVNGNLIALIPYTSENGFLDGDSDLSLVNSSLETSGPKSPNSTKMMPKAKVLKKRLFPPLAQSENLSVQSQIDSRPPLSSHDSWMNEMVMTDVEALGPDDYQEFIKLNESLETPGESEKLIEHGKVLLNNMLKDLDILKTMDSARLSKEYSNNLDIAPNQYIANFEDPLFEDDLNESLPEIPEDTVQQLIQFLQPLVPLPIESFWRSPTSVTETNLINLISPDYSLSNSNLINLDTPNQSYFQPTSSSVNQSVLADTLNTLMDESAALRQQVNESLNEMEFEILNSDISIPEYEKAFIIASRKKVEIFEPILEVSEINQTMIALVENPDTGEKQQILVDLVPTSPSSLNTGRIVGYMEEVGN